ncbi:MAG TPA: AzlD domain-containing protein [Solirubrobacteraceae bacterium]|jgi:branched-subunit amino acid transport protein|nr:AzlD domain-containing protein [Solirubrobacteraceae bacterium]
MSAAWGLVLGSAVITFAIKAAGPVALGGRRLPAWFASIVTLMAPALLAALVATHTLADGRRLAIGPQTAGVLVAGVVGWRTRSISWCVVTAAAVTALLRAL